MLEKHKVLESIVAEKQENKVRLSDFVLGRFVSLVSNKSTKKAVKNGLVWVNGQRGYSGDYIAGGEHIELMQGEEKKNVPQLNLEIEVCYEDEYLAVVNKPAGLLVSGNKHRTLENALSSNLLLSQETDALQRPEPIHRLDYPTSGALLIGKTKQAVLALNKVFEERSITKKYVAITVGKQEESGMVELDVDGKNAKSSYRLLNAVTSERFGFLNLVELTLFTGRRHQLRIHMQSIGNPILGDAEYGKEGQVLQGKGLYLHSHSLEFTHPFTNKTLKVEVNPPKKFNKLFSAD
ncbi:RluA family pseudouridine synthase [Labilibacter marinus]|uniref:RluA family pseudouridine synthase n=1 Tax=Labilibacter marinus TaxID=1477105 RepID=UPI000836C6BA|nr:RluA family pseudouridine synthase [Labilibacter marinus]